MPFSTRLRVETVDLIDQIVAREGLTQRAVVEQAITATWGNAKN